MKNTYYFKHDYNARNDEKLIKLLKDLGFEGIGIYWCLVEMLYESGGYLELDYENLLFNLRTQCERITIEKVINAYNLFEIASNKLSNRRVISELKSIKSKSEKAKISAKFRWKKNNANEMRTQCEGNAKEEKRREEKREDKNKELTVFDFKEKLELMLNSSDWRMPVIATYWQYKNITFENENTYSNGIKRELRAVGMLKGYSLERIKEVMFWLNGQEWCDWGVFTVHKYIDKDLKKIEYKYGKK